MPSALGDGYEKYVNDAIEAEQLGFDGYGIGGLSVGESRGEMIPALAAALDHLPTTGNELGQAFRDPELEAKALEMARRGASTNGVAERVTFEKANVLRALEHYRKDGRSFDLVVVDPPRLVGEIGQGAGTERLDHLEDVAYRQAVATGGSAVDLVGGIADLLRAVGACHRR